MPEVARCNAIEVGEAVVRADSKIEACDQVEQALIGAIHKQPAQGLARARPCSRLRVFAGRCGKSASRDAAAKATRASRSCQPLQIIEEATESYSRKASRHGEFRIPAPLVMQPSAD